MSISSPQQPAASAIRAGERAASDVAPDPSPRRSFPGWRWMAVWPAFPVAGYIGWKVGGRVDAALVGGAITAAGLGAVQCVDEPFIVDATRAETELGLRATPLADAVEQTVRWYRARATPSFAANRKPTEPVTAGSERGS